ncbi:Uncharacterized protein HZ326_31674 [Fusarium oxysporum f. sp. albedinis]|nr:Uncharacterized protein HZ326_31674 [Fusarium oxysporum f. sp. albedinis]
MRSRPWHGNKPSVKHGKVPTPTSSTFYHNKGGAPSSKWHFPTRSQPHGSFKHIILDVKAGSSGKVPCNCYSI